MPDYNSTPAFSQGPTAPESSDAAGPFCVLSLCDHSGSWSRPYREAGYHVIQVDPKNEHREEDGLFLWRGTVADVLRNLSALPRVRGILAAPPCTDFSKAGAQYWDEKDSDGRTAGSVQVVRDILSIVLRIKPKWWALENPPGRITKMVPELGNPTFSFEPWQLGDPWTKYTHIWGEFTPPLPLFLGEDRSVRPGGPHPGWKRGSGRTKELRAVRQAAVSETPPGFARAFFEVNP